MMFKKEKRINNKESNIANKLQRKKAPPQSRNIKNNNIIIKIIIIKKY